MLRSVIIWIVLLAIGFALGWGSKPQTMNVDKSWEFFPRYTITTNSFPFDKMRVEALRPSSPHSRGDRLRCSDCGFCHVWKYCSSLSESYPRKGDPLVS